MNPKKLATRNSIPKGLRLKAQGCDSSRRSQAKAEERATLGKSIDDLSTPKGLRPIDVNIHLRDGVSTPLGLGIFEQRCPRVARSSQPWAGGHNPFGIEDPSRERLPQALVC